MSDDKKPAAAGANQTAGAVNLSEAGGDTAGAETKVKKAPVAGRSSMTKADAKQFGLSASVYGKGLK